MRIKKGDTVKVLYGKDSGKQGKVLKVLPRESKVVVDGVNLSKKHIKGDNNKKKSEIVSIVKPLASSKVQLICPNCSKASKVGVKVTNSKSVRFCKNCGKDIETGVKTETKAKTVKKETKNNDIKEIKSE